MRESGKPHTPRMGTDQKAASLRTQKPVEGARWPIYLKTYSYTHVSAAGRGIVASENQLAE
jgi:hypothetical protein